MLLFIVILDTSVGRYKQNYCCLEWRNKGFPFSGVKKKNTVKYRKEKNHSPMKCLTYKSISCAIDFKI